MIPLKKQGLIKLCIKIMGLHDPINISLISLCNLIRSNYPSLPEKDVEEIKEKFSVEKYVEKILPIFDQNFTEEEIKEINKFYSSKIGIKITDPVFLEKIKKIGDYFVNEIEKEFYIRDSKSPRNKK